MTNVKTRKNRRLLAILIAVLTIICVGLPLEALSAGGPPEGKGSGDKGRQKDDADKGVIMGDLFGDQIALRLLGPGSGG